MGQLLQSAEIFGSEVGIAERSDIRHGFIQCIVEGKTGQQEDVDQGFDEEEDGTKHEGGG